MNAKKRFSSKLLSIVLVIMMVFSTFAFASCGEESTSESVGESVVGKIYDNESDPLVFSSAEVDRVFNPFFSTNAADSSVVGMTQIGMLSNDKDGKPVYGENQPTVTQDLLIVDNGGEEDVDLKTTYYFVLKNNVRFSDGSYLTIKDVLFNLYVYLDPVYTGSSTIYSTDIVGLDAYRYNTNNETEQDNFMSRFQTAARTRIESLIEIVVEAKDMAKYEEVSSVDAGIRQLAEERAGVDAYANVLQDYAKAGELFKEELRTDLSNSRDSFAEFKVFDEKGKAYENMFASDVEMFLYNEGYITWNKKEAKMVSSVHNDYTQARNMTEEQAIDFVYKDKYPNALDEIVSYWATATSLQEYIVNAEMSKYFDSTSGGINNISGIKFENKDKSITLPNGDKYDKPEYNKDGSVKSGNEVLSITINNIDPKAIWNFSFGIAPMSYYSSAEEIAKFDYINHFGVKKGSQDFMQDVVKDPNKIGLPMGAGPYAASKASGGLTNVKESDFYDKGVIYFERNPYYVLGAPKIKNIRYYVVASAQMLNNLYEGVIDFAEPNAKPETEAELNSKKSQGIENESVRTMGYGYIGVNAGKIPYTKVRQAIMHSINTQLCVSYYQTSAQPIFRPMSLESWAYPKGATAYYPYVGSPIPEDLSVVSPDYKNYVQKKGWKAGYTMTLNEQKEFIKYLVESADFTVGGDGVYTNNGHKLSYTFTIAGEEKDHPAWAAMYQAGQFLNTIGFNIITKTDANALSKLSNGELTVWAAAWGSTIDPDMYQVYHMESKATSTLNWGYKQILANPSKYKYEYDLIEELSDIIDNARKTDDMAVRSDFYKDALDIVMQLAVELPTYQRNDLFAYNAGKIDKSTLTPKSGLSAFYGLTTRIHTVSLITQ